MSCVLDWVMVIPLTALMKTDDKNQSPLGQVFEVISIYYIAIMDELIYSANQRTSVKK